MRTLIVYRLKVRMSIHKCPVRKNPYRADLILLCPELIHSAHTAHTACGHCGSRIFFLLVGNKALCCKNHSCN